MEPHSGDTDNKRELGKTPHATPDSAFQ